MTACTSGSSKIESWTYQLQSPDPTTISKSGFDLAVIDYSRDGSAESAFDKSDLSVFKQRSNGCNRIVLAYLSIGEAEDYRYYWKPEWSKKLPVWLSPENEEWAGNYVVEYWRPEWQRLIYGSPDAYLDKIIAAGFDGVYLDRVDVYWELSQQRPSAQADMIAFVRKLAAYARTLKSGFLIVPQNAEGLLENPDYLATIDGNARESLHLMPGSDGIKPPDDEYEYSHQVLTQALKANKFVLTVDYVSNPSDIEQVYREGRSSGFVPYVTVRALDKLTVNDGFDPVPK